MRARSWLLSTGLLAAALSGAAAAPPTPAVRSWLERAAGPLARRDEDGRLGRALDLLDTRKDEMVALLGDLVLQNSGSRNPAGITKVLDRIRAELAPMGFEMETVAATELGGPHLLARTEGAGRRVLMMGHVDTIFEADHPFQDFRVDGDIAYGPGVRDMKGGVVVMIHVLRALHEVGALAGRPVTLLFNGDEETGSLSSRPVIEREARRASLGLVFEGGTLNRITTSRGGLGQGRFEIRGVPVHIASRPFSVDANQELAEKMTRLLALNDPARRIHVNVAPVQGGIKRNQVSGLATGEIDLRFRTSEDGEALAAKVREILSTSYVRNARLGKATETRFELLLHRPPFEEGPGVRALLGVYQAAGREFEMHLSGASSSGGSDQNLIAALGVPCLDSLGIRGSGAHTVREQGDLTSLVPAAKLTAVALHRLWRADRAR